MEKLTGEDWIQAEIKKHGRAAVDCPEGHERYKAETGSACKYTSYRRTVQFALTTMPEHYRVPVTAEEMTNARAVDTERFEENGLSVTSWSTAGPINHRTKVTYGKKRLSIEDLEAAYKRMVDYGTPYLAPTTAPVTPTKNRLLELPAADFHVGKLIPHGRYGDGYDLHNAVNDILSAQTELLQDIEVGSVSAVVSPFMGDILNIDNMSKTTTAGTPQTNSDVSEMIDATLILCTSWIDALLKYGVPIHVPVVPGNHDSILSRFLGAALEARYYDNPHVTVAWRGGKFQAYQWHDIGFLYGHGERGTAKDFVNLLSYQFKPMFASTHHHLVRLGHLHSYKKHELLPSGDSYQTVQVERLYSPSPTDEWAHENHFRGVRKLKMWLHEIGGRCTVVEHPVTRRDHERRTETP